ncbi:heme exporter protein CcmB [Candidatus Poriferisodalis sp.]|uniref:heme exporter protein CcmB n=1 Tax=Candidatus Poriferisodalis sp. TaxID=3101277 RepID=UPI003B02533F
MWREIWLVCRKDVTIERRARITLVQIVPIVLLVLVVFAFGLDANPALLRAGAGGLFWVAVLFGTVLGAKRSFDVEADDGHLDALRLTGLAPAAVLLGKAAALALQLVVVGVFAAAGLLVLYSVTVREWLLVVAAGFCGVAALAVCGTLYGAMTAGLRTADTLLPLLLIPVAAPVLLAGTRAFDVALGASADQGWSWTALLAVVLMTYIAVGWSAAGVLLEDA